MISYFILGALSFGLIDGKEKWSTVEEEAVFEPGFTILENWTSVTERNEKIIRRPAVDRYIVTKPSKEPLSPPSTIKDVSETDIFLLGAIEKLAYRLDFLEKRLQRTEQMLYLVIAGNQHNDKSDPCPQHFVHFGGYCYHVSSKQLNWKSASSTCRNLGSALLEFETSKEESTLIASLQLDSDYEGKDYWTGGLNPGLLWIWSNSAKPVLNNGSQAAGIKNVEGNGRCLLMAYNPAIRNYRYTGVDCSARNYFICKYQENSTGRQLERLERRLSFRKVDV